MRDLHDVAQMIAEDRRKAPEHIAYYEQVIAKLESRLSAATDEEEIDILKYELEEMRQSLAKVQRTGTLFGSGAVIGMVAQTSFINRAPQRGVVAPWLLRRAV